MEPFLLYLRLGLEHITDLAGYDHILFVAALCLRYRWSDWRRLLWLVTAFTLGHSISLALATLGYIAADGAWIEFLIPVTIVIAAAANLMSAEVPQQKAWGLYLLAIGFGLIHGLGFSGYLRSLLGREAELLWPLLAFNIGLEIGQLLIVAAILTIGLLFRSRNTRRWWVLIASVVIVLLALHLAVSRWPL